MAVLHQGQSLLVAVGNFGGAWVLGVQGDWVQEQTELYGGDIYLFPAVEEGGSMDPGHYVWEGVMSISSPGPDGEVAHAWDGTWRPATLADFSRFQFPAPAGTSTPSVIPTPISTPAAPATPSASPPPASSN